MPSGQEQNAQSFSRRPYGERPVYNKYSENFEAETCSHVYCRDLPEALEGTPWQYCPIKDFCEHFHEPMQPMQLWPFLAAYIEHHRLEHLVKVGFCHLASDLSYGRAGEDLLDEAQDRTHRILRVTAEDVDFLRDMDVTAETLRIFQEYAGVKDRRRLLCWQMEHAVTRDVAPCLEHVTAHKLMRYIDEQFPVLHVRKTEYGAERYRDMQSVVSEYRDYLEMCARLGYDMRNSFVLFPKDLQNAHDRVQRRVKIEDAVRLREDFTAAMKSIARHLDFEMDGMVIVVPTGPDEIVAEGQALKHCVGVGGYIERVARRESIILFLRLSENPDRPFFTIEIKNKHCVQIRGLCNCPPSPEVQAFVERFERQVLMAA